MISYKAFIAAILTSVILLMPGCKQKDESAVVAMGETSIRETVVVAQPKEAVDQIYASLKEYEANPITSWQLKDLFEIDDNDILEYYGKISDPASGLSDVVVLLPVEEKRDDIQLALSKYKEKRIAEFEDYDILDAYPISQGAVIFDQGDYIIMLMLADNESARTIIDQYIPL